MGNSIHRRASIVYEINETKRRGRKRKVTQVRLTHLDESDGRSFSRQVSAVEERPSVKFMRQETTVHFDEGEIEVRRSAKDVVKYCLQLITTQFVGETTTVLKTDEVESAKVGNLHLGECLRLVDSYLRQFNSVHDFTGNEIYFLKLLSYIAKLRRTPDESEEECYNRFYEDSRRFVVIYHRRGCPSQELPDHKNYWGSRQQLRSSKVIGDWVDHENGPIDPIFGALLQPTTGRAGAGDSGWFHELVFDEHGLFAFHSAVHDAFGYLICYHNIGPGYDYMYDSLLSKTNPLAGQVGGLNFWKKVLNIIDLKHRVCQMALASSSFDLLQWHPESRRGSLIF